MIKNYTKLICVEVLKNITRVFNSFYIITSGATRPSDGIFSEIILLVNRVIVVLSCLIPIDKR